MFGITTPRSPSTHAAAKNWQRYLAIATASIFVLVASAILANRSFAGPEDCAENNIHIEVTVENVRSPNGLIAAVLYDGNPGNFLASGRSVSKTRTAALEGATRICVDAPGPGTYALIIYHDENGDREFDITLAGRPREGAGFSNNPLAGQSLPRHEQVQFAVEEEVEEIVVFLNYP